MAEAEGRLLRIGILGTARIADKLCWAIEQTSTARVTAVASRSLERATAWAQVRGIAHVFGGYAELIESGVCDAVYVALPTALHAEWAIRAADARLHVLCEKPLASSLVEAEAMSAACAAAGVVLLDGQMWPWHTRTAAMLSAARSMGSIRHVTAHLSFKADETFWQSNIRASASLEPLGALGDLGWYCVSIVEEVLCHQEPLRVMSHTEWAPTGVPAAVVATMVYTSGATAVVRCGFDAARRDFLEVECAEGVLRCDDWVHPKEFDSFGMSLAELRERPPTPLPATYQTREAGNASKKSIPRSDQQNKKHPEIRPRSDPRAPPPLTASPRHLQPRSLAASQPRSLAASQPRGKSALQCHPSTPTLSPPPSPPPAPTPITHLHTNPHPHPHKVTPRGLIMSHRHASKRFGSSKTSAHSVRALPPPIRLPLHVAPAARRKPTSGPAPVAPSVRRERRASSRSSGSSTRSNALRPWLPCAIRPPAARSRRLSAPCSDH